MAPVHTIYQNLINSSNKKGVSCENTTTMKEEIFSRNFDNEETFLYTFYNITNMYILLCTKQNKKKKNTTRFILNTYSLFFVLIGGMLCLCAGRFDGKSFIHYYILLLLLLLL